MDKTIRGFFFVSLALLILSPRNLLAEDLKSIAESREWLNLGHYKESWFGKFKSESEQSPFFFSPKGHRSPLDELKATITAFNSELTTTSDQHPLCRFPARKEFLQTQLPQYAEKWNSIECPEFEKFLARFDAKSVSLVFSSYFLDTPASAFGHTLLRFSKNPNETASERYELLDYAANYAAVVTTGNSLLYAIMGMAGGFLGEFAVMPYFYKVREYNDFESRDIWDYELNLNQSEVNQLIAHLFEMKWARFPYYYLSHNCSYHMLSMLDVANSSWRLADRLDSFVIPVDTIRVVAETPNLVRSISYRPSKRKVLDARLSRLTSKEQVMVKNAIQAKDPNLLSADPKAGDLIDAAIDSIDFLNAKEMVNEDPEVLGWKRQFLIARSRVSTPTEPVNLSLPERERPDSGHRSRRFTLGYAHDENLDGASTLEYRFALHDFLDPLEGHNPGSSMEMGRIKLRYNHKIESQGDRSHLWLEDFALVEVKSLSPVTSFFRSPSWRAYLGGKTIRDKAYQGLFAPTIELAGGATIGLGERSLLVFFAQTKFEQNKYLSDSSLRISLGPEMNLILRTTWNWNFIFMGQYNQHFISKGVKTSYNYGMKSKWQLGTNFTLNFDIINYSHGLQGESGFSYYF